MAAQGFGLRLAADQAGRSVHRAVGVFRVARPARRLLRKNQYGVAGQGALPPRAGHEPLSEQRLAIGGGSTRAPARWPGRRSGSERGLDGGRDELRGLRVDYDVPAEQHAADDLPGVPGGGGGTGGIGLGHI